MKQSTIFIFLFVCLFFSSTFNNEVFAQSSSVTIQYGGFVTQCCSANSTDYYCFDSAGGPGGSPTYYCGSPTTCNTQSFFDPVPAGNIVTQVQVTYYSAGCAGGTMSGTLNGAGLGTVFEANTGCACTSTTWSPTGATTANYPCGITNAGYPYNYGANNSFQFCASGQVCIDRAVLTIFYVPANQANPASSPTAISGTTPVCAGTSYPYSIPAVANATSYTWTVPAGWTINSGQGTTNITATPGSAGNICVTATNLCGTSAATCYPVTISTPSTAPTSASSSPNPICVGSSSTLTVSGGALGVGANWNWYSGSCGGTLVGSGPSIVVSPGATTNYYVQAQGTCNTTSCVSTTVTVTPIATPTFTQVAAICSGAALAALPTTSNNGITGTWSPVINNTATTLYTFTPTAGACATTATMTITVNPNVTPTFTQVSPICDGDALAALPTTSTNGITGTWSPAINNTTTTLYTFTPTAGQCATTTTMTITVTPNVTPTFTQVNPICSGDPLSALPTTSNNGITGTWSPAINNTATTLYTFTPTGGSCTTTATMTIIVTANVTPTFTQVNPICDGDALAALPTTSNNGITGTWSPAINNTATTLYTFTPTVGLCATTATTMTITVNPNIAPTFTQVNPICDGDALAALPTTSNNGITGTWSPAINNTTTTLYTFTPTAGLCATTATMTITVNPIPTTQDPVTICTGDSYTFPDGTTQNNITAQVIYNSTLQTTVGCDSIVVTTLTVTPLNTVTPTALVPICPNDPLTLSANGTGSGIITWYSDPAGTTVIDTGSPLTIINPGTGVYTYYVINEGICPSNVDSVTLVVGGVTAVINATPETGAIPLNVFFGNGSTTGPGITYSWDFGDGNTSSQYEPSNIYTTIGVYEAVLIVTDGLCPDTISVFIDVFGESVVLIPNVFTPNGDGQNDIFTVKGVNLKSVECEIFNRWGQKMFSWSNVKGHWDGRTLSGVEAPDGSYFYIITAVGIDGAEYFKKGGFSLVR